MSNIKTSLYLVKILILGKMCSPQKLILGGGRKKLMSVLFWKLLFAKLSICLYLKSFAKLKILSSKWDMCSPLWEEFHRLYMLHFFPVNFSNCVQGRKVTTMPAGENAFSGILCGPLPRNYRCCGQILFVKFVTMLPSL